MGEEMELTGKSHDLHKEEHGLALMERREADQP